MKVTMGIINNVGCAGILRFGLLYLIFCYLNLVATSELHCLLTTLVTYYIDSEDFTNSHTYLGI